MHLVKVSELDVGRPYSFMVTRLLACQQSVVLGLRRQRGVRPGVGMRRSSTTVEWRSLIGLGAEARQAEAELGGTYKPKEVCPQAGFADFTSSPVLCVNSPIQAYYVACEQHTQSLALLVCLCLPGFAAGV